jgi:hypothetical protein
MTTFMNLSRRVPRLRLGEYGGHGAALFGLYMDRAIARKSCLCSVSGVICTHGVEEKCFREDLNTEKKG